jgi:hypothetical protein
VGTAVSMETYTHHYLTFTLTLYMPDTIPHTSLLIQPTKTDTATFLPPPPPVYPFLPGQPKQGPTLFDIPSSYFYGLGSQIKWVTQFIVTFPIEGDVLPRRGRRRGQPLGAGHGEAGHEGVAQVLFNISYSIRSLRY